MSKVLKAEYDVESASPVDGDVSVVAEGAKVKPPWSDLRGLLSGEEGEEFARIIEEAFPIEPVRKQ